jgi:hypothetical protein
VTIAPRALVVTRPTEYDELLAHHGTVQQARFFLHSRGQSLEEIERRHRLVRSALHAALAAIPFDWRRATIGRRDLSRFVFGPEDVVIAVGQDGLVANVAKYLSGQPVIGVNPDPQSYDGILVPHTPAAVQDLLLAAHLDRARIEERIMVEALLDDGQRLVALNEIFVGHRTHQSARYRIRFRGTEERHSSSGLIVATGTGATGWALSISRERPAPPPLPAPTEHALAFFVREAFPSVLTDASLTAGLLGAGESLGVVSEMSEGGVLFGDGIEDDRLAFPLGTGVEIATAEAALRLVQA